MLGACVAHAELGVNPGGGEGGSYLLKVVFPTRLDSWPCREPILAHIARDYDISPFGGLRTDDEA